MENSTSMQRFGRRVSPFIIEEMDNGLNIKVNNVFAKDVKNTLFRHMIEFIRNREADMSEAISDSNITVEVFKEEKRVTLTIDSTYNVALNIKSLKEIVKALGNTGTTTTLEYMSMVKHRGRLSDRRIPYVAVMTPTGDYRKFRGTAKINNNDKKLYLITSTGLEVIIEVNKTRSKKVRKDLMSYLILFMKNNLTTIANLVEKATITALVDKAHWCIRLPFYKKVSNEELDISTDVTIVKNTLNVLNKIKLEEIVEYVADSKDILEEFDKGGNFIVPELPTNKNDWYIVDKINEQPVEDVNKNHKHKTKVIDKPINNHSRKVMRDKCGSEQSTTKDYLNNVRDSFIEYSRANVNDDDYIFTPLSDGKYVMMYKMIGRIKHTIVIPEKSFDKKSLGECVVSNCVKLTLTDLISRGIIENGCKVAIIKPHKA